MVDVVVIGGGPAGTSAAIRAAQLGGRVALVEFAHLGGSCVNQNCVPLTSLLATVELFHRIARAGEMGVKVGPARLDLSEMRARKDRIVSELREGMAGLLPTFGVEVIHGQARVVDMRTVEVAGTRIRAERGLILATGARWAPLPKGVSEVTRPDEALELAEPPGRMMVWGGEPSDVEIATLFAALGSRVLLVVEGPHPLPTEDYEVGQRLQAILTAQGIEVITGATVQSAKRDSEGLRVVLSGSKGAREVIVDRMVWGCRVPATGGLGLEEIGLEVKDGAIAVDDRQRTNLPTVFAAGDVTGHPMYSSVATSSGLVAAENAMGRSRKLDRRLVPRYAFSIPEVAAVGLTEDQAADAGYDVEVSNVPLATNARAMGLGEVEGGIKLVADSKRGRLLGVHIVGHRATELIAEAALALQLEALAEDLAWAVRIHPTLSESTVEAARALLGQALYLPRL